MLEMVRQLRRSFEYDDWANREVIRSIEKIAEPPESCVKLLAHMAAAQRIWYARLHHEDSSAIAVWPSLDLKECSIQLATQYPLWEKLLRNITAREMSEYVVYHNSKGQEFKNTVQEILVHVINHATYHRAQIAAEIRKSGGTPALTDYIVFCRR
jgi:uncharacterized damage-inducible protein DinB